MRRFGLVLSALMVGFVMAPTSAHGSVIQCFDSLDPNCIEIAEFQWLREDPFGTLVYDDRFFVKNTSTEEISSLNLNLTPDPLVSTGFASDPLGAGVTTEAINIFQGITAAQLTFIFQGSPFSLSLEESMLAFDVDNNLYFKSTFAYAETVVPEPSAMLLLGSGLAITAWVRRRKVRLD